MANAIIDNLCLGDYNKAMNGTFGNHPLISWITSSKTTNNLLVFRRRFSLKKEIRNATLMICGLGFYQGFINDRKLDDCFNKPVVTDYKKRNDPFLNVSSAYFAYYDTYDVSSFLTEENELKVIVAPGYFHNVDKLDAPNYDYGKPRLYYLLTVNYRNGEKEEIYSSPLTEVAVSASISRLFLGNHVNFMNRQLDYTPAVSVKTALTLKKNPIGNDIIQEKYEPVCLLDERNHKIFDFSKNHTGDISCLIQGRKGQKVTIRYAEFMSEDGSLNYFSSAFADFSKKDFVPPFSTCTAPKHPVFQENTYVLSGETDQIEPLFSYRTYRYIEICSKEEFTLRDLVSNFIYASVKQISSFHSSNELINHIYDCYIQTEKCNMHSGLFTDCPHREKSAYTGDGQVTVDTVLRNFDAVNMMDKWLDDIIASQNKNGRIPNTVPDFAGGGGDFWGYAVIRIPLTLYQYTGDKIYLEKSYPAMYRWIIYLLKSRDKRGVISSQGNRWFLGDWLAPEPIASDPEYLNSLCLLMAMERFFKVMEILSHPVEEELFYQYRKVKDAIHHTYFHPDSFTYSNNKQGETMMAIYAKAVPSAYLEQVSKSFLDTYKKKDAHIDTGFILTPYLFELLMTYNEVDTAYSLLTRTDYPSYFYLLKNETTIPEHWSKKWIPYKMNEDDQNVVNELTGDVSHCHPMYGAIVSWIEKYIGGISLKDIKDKKVIFSPKFTDKIEEVSSSYREIFFSYSRKEELVMEVNLPQGYSGMVILPDNRNETYHIISLDSQKKWESRMPITLDSGHYRIMRKKEEL